MAVPDVDIHSTRALLMFIKIYKTSLFCIYQYVPIPNAKIITFELISTKRSFRFLFQKFFNSYFVTGAKIETLITKKI